MKNDTHYNRSRSNAAAAAECQKKRWRSHCMHIHIPTNWLVNAVDRIDNDNDDDDSAGKGLSLQPPKLNIRRRHCVDSLMDARIFSFRQVMRCSTNNTPCSTTTRVQMRTFAGFVLHSRESHNRVFLFFCGGIYLNIS